MEVCVDGYIGWLSSSVTATDNSSSEINLVDKEAQNPVLSHFLALGMRYNLRSAKCANSPYNKSHN